MKKLLFLALIIVSLTFTSCSVSSNLISNHNVTQTSIELSQKNYVIVRSVEASAEATYVIGIGGLSKKSLVANATADMFKNANLTGSQAIINQNFIIKNTGFFPIFWKYKAVSYGQVVEFTE